MSRVRRNAEGFLETEQWKCRSYAAAKRRLSLVYCYVQGGYDAVVVRSEDADVFALHLAFSSSIDTSLFQKCGTQTRTRLNWLLLSWKMFVRLSLVFIPSPDVTQLVLLLVKANSSP